MSWEQQAHEQGHRQTWPSPGYDPEYGYSGWAQQPYPQEQSYPHEQSYPQEQPETVQQQYSPQQPDPAQPPYPREAPVDAEAEEEKPPPRPPGRDRYFDTLRAVALIRVVGYHTFGWAWAGLVFPSMGIMFGLAGTLMAKSLERPAFEVVRSRMRRLLPPFWFWGVFVVLAMLVHGWMPGRQIVFWVLPLGDPPGNAWGEQAWEILWYLRTYLWFVLLSPLLLRVFRLAPVPVLLLSLAPIVVLQFLWEPPDDRLGSALTDLATFLFCWILGFAHRDGVLERLKPFAVVVLSLAALGFGGWYAFTHQAETGSYDLDDIPLAQAFWSAGYVTLLMWAKAYFGIDFAWLTRFRRTDRLVTVFNSRAVTIYLWHEIALILAVPLIDLFWDVPAFEKWLPLESQWFLFGVGWVLIAVFVLVCGWVEDVAGKKKPQLLPGRRPARMSP
ncbi:acyltransferase family protein [Streptomyces griseorubiginosus]|uniref:acyltransferase family protein n=1 Tax=Streptomyces griseorubiginosus TaxID=67304 RepID=UPI00076DB3E5|nr:acyltransferase family protein [Streptomyces griseorubiginosus]KUM77277.1 integral membrane transferase [Streptomyces griseorubiginosus]